MTQIGNILWWDGPSATIQNPVLPCQFQKLAGDQCGRRVRDVAEWDCPSQGDTPNLCSLPPRKQDVLVMGWWGEKRQGRAKFAGLTGQQ